MIAGLTVVTAVCTVGAVVAHEQESPYAGGAVASGAVTAVHERYRVRGGHTSQADVAYQVGALQCSTSTPWSGFDPAPGTPVTVSYRRADPCDGRVLQVHRHAWAYWAFFAVLCAAVAAQGVVRWRRGTMAFRAPGTPRGRSDAWDRPVRWSRR